MEKKRHPAESERNLMDENMSNKIKHSGIVDRVEEGCVTVRILQTSACAQCKIAGHCNSSESKEKIIEVRSTDSTRHLKVGDTVTVMESVHVAISALLVGFGLPLLVLLVILFSVYAATGRETFAAVCAIGALIPYYIVVWLFRGYLHDRMLFEIE